MTQPRENQHANPDATTAVLGGPTRLWTRYVAIGDSFTEGMCDEDPTHPDRYVGWADRLAGHLDAHARAHGQEFGYANLAVRGRLLADIVGPQLDAAMALQPDLVSIIGGGNDIMRPKVDLDDIAAQLEAAVVRVRATGADVLLATPTDPSEGGLLGALRGRHGIHTANVFTIAQKHGCHVLNQWTLKFLKDWRMWADDRIHMTTEGHRRVALAALAGLGFDTDRSAWETPLEAEPPKRVDVLKDDLRWSREFAGPWVQRRLTGRSSGDGRVGKRPELLPLAEDFPGRG